MGVEKISAGSAMAYQGSAASAATSASASVEPVAATASTITQVAGAAMQKFSLNPDTGEEKNSAEDRATLNNKQLKEAVSDLNKQLKNSEAIFGVHEETNRVTIKIVDKDTKEVLKEYPPEQTLDMIAKVWEIAGILVDEKR